MAGWDAYLGKDGEAVYANSGFGGRVGFGRRPVIMVIDVNYAFCGDRSLPVAESVEEWPYSCGEAAWAAIPRIADLLDSARARNLPIIYTTSNPPRPDGLDRGLWRQKCLRDTAGMTRSNSHEIVNEIAAAETDIVLTKGKPSAFFGTELLSHLTFLGADSLIVCGTTTSGCVRATVTDGFSYNYRVAVVEECTFDRVATSHWINLFEMDQKYGDVVPLSAATEFIAGLSDSLFSPVPA
jgi:maleamate amidohydrolase